MEEPIDRLPCHTDCQNAIDALQDFKSLLQLQDDWRKTYPTTKAYSYYQKSTGSHSHIDRIYATEEQLNNCYDWEIETTGIETDHKLTSVLIASPTMPFVGKG